MNRKVVLTFVIFFLYQLSFAQEEVGYSGSGDEQPYDPEFVQLLEDSLVLRVFTIQKINSLLINEANQGERQLVLKPNENTNLGFGFNYRWIGLNLAFNFPFVNNDDDLYGQFQVIQPILVYGYPKKIRGINFLSPINSMDTMLRI